MAIVFFLSLRPSASGQLSFPSLCWGYCVGGAKRREVGQRQEMGVGEKGEKTIVPPTSPFSFPLFPWLLTQDQAQWQPGKKSGTKKREGDHWSGKNNDKDNAKRELSFCFSFVLASPTTALGSFEGDELWWVFVSSRSSPPLTHSSPMKFLDFPNFIGCQRQSCGWLSQVSGFLPLVASF